GPRLRRLAALTGVCQPALVATIDSTASFVPAFGPPPFMRGFSPPLTPSERHAGAERHRLLLRVIRQGQRNLLPERTARFDDLQRGEQHVDRAAHRFSRILAG
ncbi:MAG TPA: hypothetical protein VND19_12775, partial [Acetobacteraceae bacterium]|nr:hypothetical protein [Acetobacteraceae bacterium]